MSHLRNDASIQAMTDGNYLKSTVVVKAQVDEDYSLDNVGTIPLAKLHRSANRPMHKLQEFTKETVFCYCCNLPCKKKGIIEPFHFCDSTDKFSECGIGTSLYFWFFRFSILCMFLDTLVLSIPILIFNHHYTKGINRVCNNLYNGNNTDYSEYCDGFVTVEGADINKYSRFNSWTLRYTTDNLKVYKTLGEEFTGNNNAEKVLVNYSIMNFIFLLTLFIFNLYYIAIIQANFQKERIMNLSIQDYTVLITNLQNVYDICLANFPEWKINMFGLKTETLDRNKFINYIRTYALLEQGSRDLNIDNINLCYKMNDFLKTQQKYEKCKSRIFQVVYNPHQILMNEKYNLQDDNRKYFHSPFNECFNLDCLCDCCYDDGTTLTELYSQKLDLESQLNLFDTETQFLTKNNFARAIFVTFETIKEKENYYNRFPHSFYGYVMHFFISLKYYFCCCCINKEEIQIHNMTKNLIVSEAPEPEDVIWENIEYSTTNRVVRAIIVYIISLLLICVSFAIVFGFTFLQDYWNDDDESQHFLLKYVISVIITLVISIFNSIFYELLERLTKFEKQISMTNYYLSCSVKFTIFTFINTAIVPLISKAVVQKARGNTKGGIMDEVNRNNLLVIDLLVLFLVNAIVSPLFWLFNFTFFYKKLTIWYCIETKNRQNYYTQRELNKIYELYDMQIAYKYSYLAKTMLITVFFMPIFPFGIVITTVGLILSYLWELFNFTHMYRRPEMLNETISMFYASHFVILLFIAGLGDYIFMHNAFSNNTFSLINLILFAILIIIPYPHLFFCNYTGVNQSDVKTKSIKDVYLSFYNDYQRQNPLTKKDGLRYYIEKLYEHGLISRFTHDFAFDNIDKINIMELYYKMTYKLNLMKAQRKLGNVNNRSILSKPVTSKYLINNSKLRASLYDRKIPEEENALVDHPEKRVFNRQIQNFIRNSVNASQNMNYSVAKQSILSFDMIPEDAIGENEVEKLDIVDYYNNPLLLNMGMSIPVRNSAISAQSLENISINNNVNYNNINHSLK